jgi:hypothetical protein
MTPGGVSNRPDEVPGRSARRDRRHELGLDDLLHGADAANRVQGQTDSIGGRGRHREPGLVLPSTSIVWVKLLRTILPGHDRRRELPSTICRPFGAGSVEHGRNPARDPRSTISPGWPDFGSRRPGHLGEIVWVEFLHDPALVRSSA